MPALAQHVGHGERVVMDAAALIARQHDDALGPCVGKLPATLRERELQPVRHVPARKCLDAAPTLLDQVLAKHLVADHALQLCGDRFGRFRFEQDAAIAERLGNRGCGVGHHRKIASHRLEEGDAKALVLRQRQERGRAAVVRDELLDGDAPGQRDRVLDTQPADLAADAIEIAPGHRGGPDEVQTRRRRGPPCAAGSAPPKGSWSARRRARAPPRGQRGGRSHPT